MPDGLSHILRARLPWRDDAKTECGLDSNRPYITQDEFYALVKDQGKQRAAMVTCMTCFGRTDAAYGFRGFGRPASWRDDPVAVLSRHLGAHSRTSQSPEYLQIRSELLAIEALIDAHREDFDGFLADLDETADLAQRRTARRRATQRGQRPNRP